MYLSYYFFKNINRHLEIRENSFQYMVKHAEEFYIFFEGNDNSILNNFSPKSLLEEYILDVIMMEIVKGTLNILQYVNYLICKFFY